MRLLLRPGEEQKGRSSGREGGCRGGPSPFQLLSHARHEEFYPQTLMQNHLTKFNHLLLIQLKYKINPDQLPE